MPVYSFGAIPFGPRVSDSVPMVSPGEMQQGIRHVPYSNYNILDLGGVTDRRYAAQIRVAPANVAAMETAYTNGASLPLIVNGVTYPAATMTKLTGHTMTPLGQWHFYDAEWSLVDNVIGKLTT